jgi:hypothetical protein
MNELKKLVSEVKGFFVGAVTVFQKFAAVWNVISNNNTKALILALFADFLAVVNEAGVAVAADGINFTADSALVAGVQKLIADAKAGDPILIADLQALGLDVSATTQAVATDSAPAPAPVQTIAPAVTQAAAINTAVAGAQTGPGLSATVPA